MNTEKEKVIAVFGLGMFGFEVCRALSGKGAKVIAVDKDQGLIQKIRDIVTEAVLLDSTDKDALLNAGLQDVDIAVVAIGNDVDDSILTSAVLKNIGVPRIIARAVSAVHAEVLRQIGATEVINIEIEEGKRLAGRIMSPAIVDVIPLSGGQELAEIRIPQKFVGRSLRDLDLRQKFNANVVSIKRVGIDIDKMGNPQRTESVFVPKPMDLLQINDILLILGSEADIASLRESIQ